MPETASIEEVEEIYFELENGPEALAIYRDNCPVIRSAPPTEKPIKKQAPADVVVEHRPVRKRLPKVRRARRSRSAWVVPRAI